MVNLNQGRLLAKIVLLCTVFFGQLLDSEAANILFYVPYGGTSHRIAMEPLANALLAKGHNISILSQDAPKENTSKIQYFTPKKVVEFFRTRNEDFNLYNDRAFGRGLARLLLAQWVGVQVCESLYSDPTYLEFIEKNKFDLVLIDGLRSDCGYGLAHTHKAKTIVFSISTVLPWLVEDIGLPDETSYISDPLLGLSTNMNFFKRLVTAIMPVFWTITRDVYYMPALTSIAKKATGIADFPSFAELERNNSLVFVNTHASQEFPRSLPPNVIPVGGISWVEKKKSLPKKFEEFISKGKEGFVYVSFGSFVDFLTFPKDVQERFLNTLRRFPNIQFIWKLNKAPENLPSHILVEKWLPQQDLLNHPKVRAFITHSGIGGVNEAIFSGVPLILFPIFAEQDYNAYLAESKGFGIRMEITALTEDDLEKAINELLTNDVYKKNMEKTKSQFLDRPMTPLDSAVWWTEYALRQDAKFLQSSNVNQHWWVKRQIDVWLFVFFVVIFFNVTWIYVVYKIVKKCCSSKGKETRTTKQKLN